MFGQPDTQPQALFQRGIVAIRKGAVLTTSYVLCQGGDVPNVLQNGNVRVGPAAQITLLGYRDFGSLTSIEIDLRPVWQPEKLFTAFTGLTSPDGEAKLGHASATFHPWMVGEWVYLSAGTNFVAGFYQITGYVSTTEVDLDAVPNSGAGSAGVGELFSPESIESAQLTASGVTTLNAHYWTMPSSEGDGRFCFTAPLAAAPFYRAYAKGTGTVTGSNLWLGYVLMPPGGV